MSKPFWTEGINTANYVRNRLVTVSTSDDRAPYEIMMGRKPYLGNIRIFGYTVYGRIQNSRQNGKFAQRARRVILVGFFKENVYRFFISKFEKVVSSQDVTFRDTRIFSPTDAIDKTTFVS